MQLYVQIVNMSSLIFLLYESITMPFFIVFYLLNHCSHTVSTAKQVYVNLWLSSYWNIMAAQSTLGKIIQRGSYTFLCLLFYALSNQTSALLLQLSFLVSRVIFHHIFLFSNSPIKIFLSQKDLGLHQLESLPTSAHLKKKIWRDHLAKENQTIQLERSSVKHSL